MRQAPDVDEDPILLSTMSQHELQMLGGGGPVAEEAVPADDPLQTPSAEAATALSGSVTFTMNAMADAMAAPADITVHSSRDGDLPSVFGSPLEGSPIGSSPLLSEASSCSSGGGGHFRSHDQPVSGRRLSRRPASGGDTGRHAAASAQPESRVSGSLACEGADEEGASVSVGHVGAGEGGAVEGGKGESGEGVGVPLNGGDCSARLLSAAVAPCAPLPLALHSGGSCSSRAAETARPAVQYRLLDVRLPRGPVGMAPSPAAPSAVSDSGTSTPTERLHIHSQRGQSFIVDVPAYLPSSLPETPTASLPASPPPLALASPPPTPLLGAGVTDQSAEHHIFIRVPVLSPQWDGASAGCGRWPTPNPGGASAGASCAGSSAIRSDAAAGARVGAAATADRGADDGGVASGGGGGRSPFNAEALRVSRRCTAAKGGGGSGESEVVASESSVALELEKVRPRGETTC